LREEEGGRLKKGKRGKIRITLTEYNTSIKEVSYPIIDQSQAVLNAAKEESGKGKRRERNKTGREKGHYPIDAFARELWFTLNRLDTTSREQITARNRENRKVEM